MRLIKLLILTAALVFTSCGKKDSVTVGGNNNANNNKSDADTPNGATNQNDGMDAGDDPIDAGSDMTMTPADMGQDTSTPRDTGRDQGAPPDMTPDQGIDAGSDTGPDMGGCPDEDRPASMACDCDLQCADDVCVDEDLAQGVEGFCATPCAERDECNGGSDACVPEDGVRACRTDDTTTDCGDGAGGFDPSQCEMSCLQAGANHVPTHLCTVFCDDADDCALGQACSPVRCRDTADGRECIPSIEAFRASDTAAVLMQFPEAAKACTPVGADNQCALPSDERACASGLCDDDQMKCSAGCLQLDDCPVGGCTDLDVSNPDLPIRFCDF